jgi:predicted ATPase
MVLKNRDRMGLDLLETGLEFVRQAGFGYQSGVIACTYLKSLLLLGETEKGLEYSDKSIRGSEQTGEEEFFPELLRLKGELLVLERRLEEAEACFEAALNSAIEQSAKMWELRAALSLGRLYVDRDELVKAQLLVRPIYDWFSEGFLLTELKEAKALLSS